MASENIEKKILRLLQADTSIDAPAEPVKWVKNLFVARAAEEKPSVLRRLIAVLQAELSEGQPVFGERSAATGQARQMLYTAGEAAVDLRITRGSQNVSVSGQVLGNDFDNGLLMLAGEHEYTARLNELGEFELSDIVPGTYSLSIAGAAEEIVVESIELGT